MLALPARGLNTGPPARAPSGAALRLLPGSRRDNYWSYLSRHQSRQQAAAGGASCRRHRWQRCGPPRAAWGGHTSLGRPRSSEAIGVVIVDAGRRTPEGDELLIDFAAAYGQAHQREIIAVANSTTLLTAVKDCVAEGADKVIVVPYCLSKRREVGGDLPTAVADVQLKLPGVRCIIGETISVETIMAQHIENQVKAVEPVKAQDVAERWWTPEPAQERGTAPAALQGERAAALPPAAQQQRAWGDAVEGAQARAGGQPVWYEQVVEEAEVEHVVVPAPAPTPAPAAPPPAQAATVAWSDDFSAALTGGVLVVDYRQPQAPAPAAAAASPAAAGTSSSSPFSYKSTSSGGGGSSSSGGGGGDIASGSAWGGDGIDGGIRSSGSSSSGSPAAAAGSSTSSGPAYWFSGGTGTDAGSSAASSSAVNGSAGGGGGGSSAAGASGPSYWYPSGQSSTGGSPGVGAARVEADIRREEEAEVEVEVERWEEAEEEGQQPPKLESRLAQMEHQLQRITSLLTQGRQGRGRPRPSFGASRAAASRRRGQHADPGGSDASDPSLYSREQLEFLRRKEQQTKQ